VVWAQHAEARGTGFPPARVAGRDLNALVIDLDATVVACHSEKQQAAADHITVLDDALAQIPDAYRHGTAVLIRADTARRSWPTSAACARRR
jgi:hypothetical protein